MISRITVFALASLMLLCCANETHAQLDDVLGVWVNTDANTRGITKFAIHDKGGTTSIRAFGSCSPKDCDMGSTEFHALGDSVQSMKLPYGFATWDHGFSIGHFTLQLEGEKMSLTTYTIFKDKSKRTNYRAHYTFRKAEGDEAELPPEKKVE